MAFETDFVIKKRYWQSADSLEPYGFIINMDYVRERSLFTAGGGGKILVQANWGGQNFSASHQRGGKILVHRHLRALPKHLENTLKNVRHRYVANTIPYNTTTFINVPTVKGHFGMMYKADITIIPSNKFTC